MNEELIRKLLPVADLLHRYFRAEVRGVSRVPAGKALIVGNHNAGITFLEPFLFGAEYIRERGGSDIRGLAHDVMLVIPGVGAVLKDIGAIPASHEAAHQAFAEGLKVAVWPGGNYEAFRPWSQRQLVDFGGHKGFVRLAIREQVPIVPLLSYGGHHAFMVLRRGERLARLSGAKRFLRSDAFPLTLGLPWGLGLGPNFHLPLPVRVTVVAGAPIVLEGTRPEDADDDAVVQRWYDEVVGTLQRMMDEVAQERPALPGVLGRLWG